MSWESWGIKVMNLAWSYPSIKWGSWLTQAGGLQDSEWFYSYGYVYFLLFFSGIAPLWGSFFMSVTWEESCYLLVCWCSKANGIYKACEGLHCQDLWNAVCSLNHKNKQTNKQVRIQLEGNLMETCKSTSISVLKKNFLKDGIHRTAPKSGITWNLRWNLRWNRILWLKFWAETQGATGWARRLVAIMCNCRSEPYASAIWRIQLCSCLFQLFYPQKQGDCSD